MPELPTTLHTATSRLMSLLADNIDHAGNNHADYPIRLHVDDDVADDLTNALQAVSDKLKESAGIDFEAISQWLYAILDDIDTAADYAKGDAERYRATVTKIQRLKSVVAASHDGRTMTWKTPTEPYGLTRL